MMPELRAGGGGLFQDAAVIGFVGGDDVVGAEFFLGVDASELAHLTTAVGAGKKINRVLCSSSDVSRFDQIAIHIVFHNFRHAAYIRRDDRNFAGHGFERREAKRFQLRRQQK